MTPRPKKKTKHSVSTGSKTLIKTRKPATAHRQKVVNVAAATTEKSTVHLIQDPATFVTLCEGLDRKAAGAICELSCVSTGRTDPRETLLQSIRTKHHLLCYLQLAAVSYFNQSNPDAAVLEQLKQYQDDQVNRSRRLVAVESALPPFAMSIVSDDIARFSCPLTNQAAQKAYDTFVMESGVPVGLVQFNLGVDGVMWWPVQIMRMSDVASVDIKAKLPFDLQLARAEYGEAHHTKQLCLVRILGETDHDWISICSIQPWAEQQQQPADPQRAERFASAVVEAKIIAANKNRLGEGSLVRCIQH